jgi:hypothetical protein
MNRRDFIVKSASAAAALAASCSVARAVEGDALVGSITIGGAGTLPSVPRYFQGLGYEISSVATRGLLGPANTAYVELVRQLGTQGVIRVGGNTADYAGYSALASAVSTPYGTVVNDAVLKDLGGFLEATGWHLIWALNLGSGKEADTVAEARAIMAIAGERLLAFEIGNEPDLFAHEKHRQPGYGYEGWLADYRRYKSALRAQLPGISFAGPDVAGKTDWVTRFAADEGKDIVLLTHHYYREGQNPGSTIEKLLGSDAKLQPQLDQLRAASRRCGVPYRICEVNSFSGGGRPGVSDTLAGALWVLDYLYTLAYNGCSGVNMETGENQLGFISSYSPIGEDTQGHPVARAEYYGLLAFLFAQGQMLEVNVHINSPMIKAYATAPTAGTLQLTLINKGETAAVLHVESGSASHDMAKVTRLSGPRLDATTGITLGGAEVSATGIWRPRKPERALLQSGKLMIDMPAASAATVEMVRT